MAIGGDGLSAKGSILLIEDDLAIVDALSEILREEGYDVGLAYNGQAALDWLAAHDRPDVILLDLMMPVMNGYEFRRRQLDDPSLAGIPTVVLTAGSIDQRLKDLGVSAWLRKPIMLEALMAILSQNRGDHTGSPDHLIHFYRDDEDLIGRVASYLAEGLNKGDAVLGVLTPAHARGVRASLISQGFDLPTLESRGQVRILDAAETLGQLMVGGVVQPHRFEALIAPAIDAAAAVAGRGGVRAFGEMVDLLWREGDVAGAIRLETFWNELARTRRFVLLCSYFDTARSDGWGHEQVRRQHFADYREPARPTR